VDLALSDHVVVVEHEDDAAGGQCKRIHQLRQADLLRRDPRRREGRVDRARTLEAGMP
jgi:hypothetical protein